MDSFTTKVLNSSENQFLMTDQLVIITTMIMLMFIFGLILTIHIRRVLNRRNMRLVFEIDEISDIELESQEAPPPVLSKIDEEKEKQAQMDEFILLLNIEKGVITYDTPSKECIYV
ncbi:hypothetical protein CDIK_2736 [Cucumispora dikerogammari]|nr:hypothetical protein CDIK_2736 [Cucumispora dikerogammari]